MTYEDIISIQNSLSEKRRHGMPLIVAIIKTARPGFMKAVQAYLPKYIDRNKRPGNIPFHSWTKDLDSEACYISEDEKSFISDRLSTIGGGMIGGHKEYNQIAWLANYATQQDLGVLITTDHSINKAVYCKQKFNWDKLPSFQMQTAMNSNTEHTPVVQGTRTDTPITPNIMITNNLILYGPPGTGKTWMTVSKAARLIENQTPNDRESEKSLYSQKLRKGQIHFVTFHQSYSYEDFIEGIRPVLSAEECQFPHYVCRAGIMKKMAEAALIDCLEPVTDQIMPENEGERSEIIKAYFMQGEKSGWKWKSLDIPQYVLIIDEINRGNISKIFGELITLIEPDKRIGSEPKWIVTLPYSGDLFGIPPNLHIIGTMNSADKSIALVDLALRRRFEFEEMIPDFSVCGEKWKDKNMPMRRIMEEINRRITVRKDRDHQIGHAYFMDVSSKEEFDKVFRRKIIPLLQEYFYNDWDGLRFVLGDDKKDNGEFIHRLPGSDNPKARTKWEWNTFKDEDILDMLQKNLLKS